MSGSNSFGSLLQTPLGQGGMSPQMQANLQRFASFAPPGYPWSQQNQAPASMQTLPGAGNVPPIPVPFTPGGVMQGGPVGSPWGQQMNPAALQAMMAQGSTLNGQPSGGQAQLPFPQPGQPQPGDWNNIPGAPPWQQDGRLLGMFGADMGPVPPGSPALAPQLAQGAPGTAGPNGQAIPFPNPSVPNGQPQMPPNTQAAWRPATPGGY